MVGTPRYKWAEASSAASRGALASSPCRDKWPVAAFSAPRAVGETGQLADPPSVEQAQRNRVYLVTAVLPTPPLLAGVLSERIPD